ncbi:MAG: UDP-Glc:alpha-D-GlcNAc-diphosphoundecaprenol beta-1,3-glucosyltransferase WfgD [Pelotomaculum sp. PtaU1.Bin065]|nr:MAG: UDP-Glc:alpha-D-GlcNAc-diphosphoundecaprenol beta-1,3-glucosyltransferase WfgD [Pelotomaculum sp. PtaU1.Bin065]
MPELSVIIPAYNCAGYLSKALASVVEQKRSDCEIIVIDDGSTDNIKNVIVSFGHKVKYISQKNKGPAAARNAGIRASDSEFIAFLDADDVWLPSKLSIQMKSLRSKPLAGISMCGYSMVDSNNIILRTYIPARINYCNKDKLVELFLTRNVVSAGSSTAIVRRKVFDEVGFFDESLKVAEDWDMWMRICRRFDLDVVYEPLARITYRLGSQSFDASKNLQNDLAFIEKIFSDPEMAHYLYMKNKAYSYRYLNAVIAYVENHNSMMAWNSFCAAVRYCPQIIFSSDVLKTSSFLFSNLPLIRKFKKAVKGCRYE